MDAGLLVLSAAVSTIAMPLAMLVGLRMLLLLGATL
jgi:hypothetical protein